MTDTRAPLTTGIHHLGLTVPQLAPTRDFFVEVLGFRLVGEKADYPAVFVSDGTVMLTLWQAQCADPKPFERKETVGLHHFALKVANLDALHDVHRRLLSAEGVEMEFAPEALGASPLQHLMCTIPGGLRLEVVAAGNA